MKTRLSESRISNKSEQLFTNYGEHLTRTRVQNNDRSA